MKVQVKVMCDENKRQLVFLEHVYSMEYYQKGEEEPKHILSDISLEMNKGEIWAFLGSSAFELRLLLEIIANARPYQSGTCVLARKGMMRKKRVVLPHVYYIGSTNMLFDNMTTLEYLMYITAKDPKDVVERQKAIFQDLIELGLSYISLSEIKQLTPSERSVVTLMAALYTGSDIIVLNVARLNYDELAIKAMKKICERIKEQDKLLVFSSFDDQLMERVADHVVCLHEGRIRYSGRMMELISQYDHLSIVIEDDRIDTFGQIIRNKFPDIEMKRNHHRLELWDLEHREDRYELILKELIRYELYPTSINVHTQCLKNAWKEVQVHDL